MAKEFWQQLSQKEKEWEVAIKHLSNAPDGTKLKKSKSSKTHNVYQPKKYSDQNNELHEINHSFMKINGEIYALEGDGKIMGKGAFGKVKFAKNKDGKLFVLKIGSQENVSEKEIAKLEDFEKLVGQTKREDKNKQYVVLEYGGKTLSDDLVKKHGGLEIGLQLVNEVEKLNTGKLSKNNKKCFHNDLKPNNVVIDTDGKISLIDFGCSRYEDEIKPGEKIGTLLFTAPELQTDKKGKHSSLTDTYSLGMILYFHVFHELPKDIKHSCRHVASLMMSEKPENRPQKSYVTVHLLM